MFEIKKTLIVVYKDELLMNQLKKLVETRDDVSDNVIGTQDDSINIVSWTEKVWLGNKKAGNIQGKILFLGDVKGTDKLIPVLDIQFNDFGVKYGWAGNQAVLFVDTKALTNRENYNSFLKKLEELPVPSFLKIFKENITTAGAEEPLQQVHVENPNESVETTEADAENKEKKPLAFFNAAKKAFEDSMDALGKMGNQVAVKSEELFRNKTLMKQQMLFYGVIHLYNDGLERFMDL